MLIRWREIRLLPVSIGCWTLVAIVTSLHSCDGVRCYACTSSLPAPQDPNDTSKFIAKKVLNSYYNLPAVSSVCNDPSDFEFANVLKLECSVDDVCTKITANVKGLKFTMRGCRNTVFKRSAEPHPCDSSQSPSICQCNEDLCNGALMPSLCKWLLLSVVSLYVLRRMT